MLIIFLYIVIGGGICQFGEAVKPAHNSYLIKTYIAFTIESLFKLKSMLSNADSRTVEPPVSGPMTYLCLFPLWLAHASCLRGKRQSQAAGQQTYSAQHGQLHSWVQGWFSGL